MRDGWDICKLSEVADRKTAKNSDGVDLVFTVSAQKGLIAQEEYFTKRVASSNLTNYYVVQPGDYVYNKSYSVDAPFGVIAKNSGTNPGLVSPIYIVFGAKAEIIDQDFLGLALSSSIFWGSLEGSLKEGGRGHGALNLKVADFFETLLPLPPLPEQKRVVDLISTVDSYIEAVRQQLERAKVSRNAVLHELLNAGGDGWVEKTLGEVMGLEYGKPLTDANRDGEGFPVYGSAGVVGRHSQPLISEGPVIVVGRKGTAGAVYWSLGPCSVIDTAYFVQTKADIAPKFLFHVLNYVNLKSVTAQTGVPGLNRDRAYSLVCKLPPKAEQERIVDLISTVDSYIDALEGQINRSVSLRSGLLSGLLSGNNEIPASYDQLIGAA